VRGGGREGRGLPRGIREERLLNEAATTYKKRAIEKKNNAYGRKGCKAPKLIIDET